MPKNIVLCSDGTGNAGGKGNNTNVWRIFNAVDEHPQPGLSQVSFYDDGVGSQDMKLLRGIGGAFGWGISLNLRQLYSFLMLHYQAGDRIYLFGFSRGAYTIRTLANMIRYCGIASCDGLSSRGLDELAGKALTLYKRRRTDDCVGKNASGGPELKLFKRDHGRPNGEPNDLVDPPAGEPMGNQHIPIEFIGVWDTVEALGLPIDEMKHGLNWLFGLQFRDGENDLHPRVRFAYHALSIDDERLTFHPTLWDESFKEPGQVVEQVWFPGVHANVGGGYPKDQLSLVALNWIMKKAYDCGLHFHASSWAEIQRDQDPFGEIYDSRGGAGMYYRYAPRDIRRISAKFNVIAEKPADDDPRRVRIHASALERIHYATDSYAPTGLPKDYVVEPPGQGPREHHPDKRHAQLRMVRDIAWWRRILYWLMLFWTLALAGFCVALGESEKVPDYGSWDVATRTLYYVESLVLDLAAMVVPTSLAPALNALRHHPWALVVFVIPFCTFYWMNSRLAGRTHVLASRAWHMSLTLNPNQREVSQRPWWLKLARHCRDSANARKLLKLRDKLIRKLAPTGFIVSVLLGLGALVGIPLTILGSLLDNPTFDGTDVTLKKGESTEFNFDTRNSLQPTPLLVERDTDYLVTVTVLEGEKWKDNGILTDPDGFMPRKGEDRLLHWLGFTRRDPERPWFKLLAIVGDDTRRPMGIGHKRIISPERSGRLYLFVNDTYGFYHNNEGTAKIKVRCIKAIN